MLYWRIIMDQSKKDYIDYKKINKLVRNKIPDMIRKNKKSMIYFQFPKTKDYEIELCKKLDEELFEVINSRTDESRKIELADSVEVLFELIKTCGFTLEEIEEIRKRKNLEFGNFSERLYLCEVEA